MKVRYVVAITIAQDYPSLTYLHPSTNELERIVFPPQTFTTHQRLPTNTKSTTTKTDDNPPPVVQIDKYPEASSKGPYSLHIPYIMSKLPISHEIIKAQRRQVDPPTNASKGTKREYRVSCLPSTNSKRTPATLPKQDDKIQKIIIQYVRRRKRL